MTLPKLGDPLPNGASVLALSTTGHRQVVLAMRQELCPDKFVVWDINPTTCDTFWGSYFTDLTAAVEEFNRRKSEG